MIKGVLLDYGGTIDTDGRHWANVLWEGYQKLNVPVTRVQFREAYVFAERALAKNEYVKPMHHFGDLLEIKCALQADYLYGKSFLSDWKWKPIITNEVTDYCYEYVQQNLSLVRPTLEKIAGDYPICLVTNFYGNIEAVLADFGLNGYFKEIVESAVAGWRKPDPRLFELSAQRLHLKPSACLMIGDSITKDIIPAQSIGCQTIWLKGEAWEDEELENEAQKGCLGVISHFHELLRFV